MVPVCFRLGFWKYFYSTKTACINVYDSKTSGAFVLQATFLMFLSLIKEPSVIQIILGDLFLIFYINRNLLKESWNNYCTKQPLKIKSTQALVEQSSLFHSHSLNPYPPQFSICSFQIYVQIPFENHNQICI